MPTSPTTISIPQAAIDAALTTGPWRLLSDEEKATAYRADEIREVIAAVAPHLDAEQIAHMQARPRTQIDELDAPRAGDEPLSLDKLEQIAAAAGHGHGHRGVFSRPNPWFSLVGNVRPVYDLRFIQTFNPQVCRHLIDRLRAAEDTLTANGIDLPDVEQHRVARIRDRRGD